MGPVRILSILQQLANRFRSGSWKLRYAQMSVAHIRPTLTQRISHGKCPSANPAIILRFKESAAECLRCGKKDAQLPVYAGM
jgi:hypothetical protein